MRLLAAALIAAPLLAATLAPSQAATPGLFGSTERMRESLKPFPKWRGTLARYFEERELLDRPCDGVRGGRIDLCKLEQWQDFLQALAGAEPRRQIDAVNREMNARSYILDTVNWGVKDYWATPGQFLHRDGDCEDYAIAKYMSLRSLGVPAAAMRIVVLHDMNLDVPHAVLAVELNGDTLILDNQISSVVRHERIRHYRPIYSVNEAAWWMHRVR